MIVSSSGDKTIIVWNANDSREVYSYSLPSTCTDASFSPDGRTIAVACKDGNIYLIDFPPLQELIDQTRERFKNYPLTPYIFRNMFGQSLRTVNRIMSAVSEKDLLKRENGKRNGRWVILY